jgi:ribosomal protein S4
MIYPGYLLNPGDMFQVEPERVMFATGAPKDARERRATRRIREKAKETKKGAVEASEGGKEVTGEEITDPTPAPASEAEEVDDIESKRKSSKVDLKGILQKAKSILADKDKIGGPSAKRKQELRAFAATVRNVIGQINRKSAQSLKSTVSSLDDELSTLLSQLSVSKSSKSADASPKTSPDSSSDDPPTESISEEDSEALREALEEARDNPIDPTKPYATPWRPRPYMSAFAFIPRYLEVNQNICAAVYLRHPVARPGLAEVPTPFGETTNQLAFTWYLRRR